MQPIYTYFAQEISIEDTPMTGLRGVGGPWSSGRDGIIEWRNQPQARDGLPRKTRAERQEFIEMKKRHDQEIELAKVQLRPALVEAYAQLARELCPIALRFLGLAFSLAALLLCK